MEENQVPSLSLSSLCLSLALVSYCYCLQTLIPSDTAFVVPKLGSGGSFLNSSCANHPLSLSLCCPIVK